MRLPRAAEFVAWVRDPIYGYVRLTRLEKAITANPYFQRLGNVRQLHSAHVVYPSATHTRKAHSLGAMWVAHRMAVRVLTAHVRVQHQHIMGLGDFGRCEDPDAPRFEIDALGALKKIRDDLPSYERSDLAFVDQESALENSLRYLTQVVRLAALLHDIGHGPLSHLFEFATAHPNARRFDHEAKGHEIVERGIFDENGPVASLAGRGDFRVVHMVLTSRELPRELKFLHEIVSWLLDADKMDYLARDSHHAGVHEFGAIDLDRLVDGLVAARPDPKSKLTRLAFKERSLDGVNNALQRLFFLYGNVYYHKVVRGFDLQVIEGLRDVAPELAEKYCFGEPGADDPFIAFDDAGLQAEIWARRTSKPYDEAWKAMQQFRGRVSKWKAILDARVAYPIRYLFGNQDGFLEGDANDGRRDKLALANAVNELRERLLRRAEESRHVIGPVLVDASAEMRAIGLKLDDLAQALETPLVWDGAHTRTIHSYQSQTALFERLVVPVKVFMMREKHSDLAGMSPPPDELADLKRDLAAMVREAQDAVYDNLSPHA